MAIIDNLSQPQVKEIFKRLRALETASPMNSGAVGSGGFEVYGGGVITISNGGLDITGTATISGTLSVGGTTALTGTLTQSGPSTFTGTTNLNGPTNIAGNTTVTGDTKLNGPTHINGNTDVTGTFTNNGPLTVNGAMRTTGTLSVEGATTLNNNLTVAAGKKVIAGGLTIENTGNGGGQVNFPGGSITASTALGMLINHPTVEIAATTTKLTGLPTNTQPANLYVDSTGRLFRSTTV